MYESMHATVVTRSIQTPFRDPKVNPFPCGHQKASPATCPYSAATTIQILAILCRSQKHVRDYHNPNPKSILTTETVKGAALTLEGVDNVEGGDSLALGVLSVGDGVTDDTLEEGLQDTTGLFVDH